ncbi:MULTISPECIES: hypothetical protein [unclassified Legionella]|uniref:EI24 domain-containing protein n=1 Tax=unclassified Legionella TaxID=2622702 RepID=UPI0010560369|nr:MULTISPECIES: hypothetical protein [unclassified Legionella]MDI9818234.1 hypothetical protein [Legionella sp. PL877]
MEHDRFKQNSKLFIIGIIALLISLSLFAFSFYILPYLLWNWIYEVPYFISNWQEWIKREYNFTHTGASWLIFGVFIIPAFIFGYLSYLISNYIDNRIYHMVSEELPETKEEVSKDVRDTLVFFLKILILGILIFVVLTLIHRFLSVPPPG